MSSGERFVARSGLKPLGMLSFCIVLFMVIAGRVTDGVVNGSGKTPKEPLVSRTHINPKWDVMDREGRVLATDSRWLELSMSPRATWQGHTPERIARGLSACLDEERSAGWRATLDRMIPDANFGVIQVNLMRQPPNGEAPIERFIAEREIRSLDDWLVNGEAGVPVSGMWLQPVGSAGRYRVCWMPELLLSEATREAQGYRQKRKIGNGYIDRPAAWCRKIGSARTLLRDGRARGSARA